MAPQALLLSIEHHREWREQARRGICQGDGEGRRDAHVVWHLLVHGRVVVEVGIGPRGGQLRWSKARHLWDFGELGRRLWNLLLSGHWREAVEQGWRGVIIRS